MEWRPNLAGKADPSVVQAVSYILDGLFTLSQQAKDRASQSGSLFDPASLSATGDSPLNVENLIGVLAQPQYAQIPNVATLPDAVFDPLSQDGLVVRLTPTGNLYRFEGSTDPGSWVGLGTFSVHFVVPGGAAAADYDGVIPIPVACRAVSVTERHQTLGTDAGAVTLMVNKVPSGTAKAGGTNILSAGINLKAATDTNQTGALHGTVGNYTFAAGDGIGLVTTGVLTAVDGVAVTILFQLQ